MRKILVFVFMIFISLNLAFANKSINLWKKLPNNFKVNCYELIWEINLKNIFKENNLLWYQTFKINSPEKIDTFISLNKIIPHRLFKKAWENINIQINSLEWNIEYLSDNNSKTFLELDTTKNKEIIINVLENSLNSNLIFNYISNNYYPEYYISQDNKKYFKISKKNISDYEFKKLKIIFNSYNSSEKFEKIKITELSLVSKNYTYLVKSLIGWFKGYSNNICRNNYINLSNNTWEFNLNSETKTLNIKLEKNNILNPNKIEDSDNDWIADWQDNCKNIYNPMQKDKNWNWHWDLCSDDDSDWIIWEKDNCIYIYNPKQADINMNWVWDKCEFDKDSDWIFDKLDNCINTPNPEQLDSDRDNIWDKCDNSIYYNPRQIDKNNNWIWDITEQKEKYLKDNDKDLDKIIDFEDNCKWIYNPKQSDSDNDWIWDFCDNCKSIQNKNQLDLNKNWKWDICEDSDWDWIEWLIDNCINISNIDQKDSDNNWVWDVCEDSDLDKILFWNDNCPYDYNPDQKDVDSDWIWDKCDESDDRFIESNNTIFIVLLLLIVALFGFGIFKMIKKLK